MNWLRALWLRLGLAVHVLRGRPLMYDVGIRGRFTIDMSYKTKVVNCTFVGDGVNTTTIKVDDLA